MKRTQVTDLFANIKATFVSFFSILMFVALGVGVFLGISWAAPALQSAADNMFDTGNFHNYQIQFPYGLTKADLEKLSDAKDLGGQFLRDAALAIVVLGDPLQNDCWVEDGSIAAISMQYQAEELGLGTCWVQMRGRGLSDGTSADTVIQGVLNIPENLSCLCILAVGHKADERKPQNEDKLKWESVHLEKF